MKHVARREDVGRAFAKDKTSNAVIEHADLLHPQGGWGLVTLAHIDPKEEQDEDRWKHKTYSVNELHDAVGEYAGCENVWLSLNRSGGRRVVKVRYLCAVYSDCDFYNIPDRNITMNAASFHLDASLSSATRCRVHLYTSRRREPAAAPV